MNLYENEIVRINNRFTVPKDAYKDYEVINNYLKPNNNTAFEITESSIKFTVVDGNKILMITKHMDFEDSMYSFFIDGELKSNGVLNTKK